jgi:hypothetical protein
VQERYRQWIEVDWLNASTDVIHGEVNTLKHDPQGIHFARNATFQDAINSIEELLDLIENWSNLSQISEPEI